MLAGLYETIVREENSRARTRTTEFILANSQATRQTRQSIVQCKLSSTLEKFSVSELQF